MRNTNRAFNFGGYGFPDWIEIPNWQMLLVYHNTQRMVRQYTPEMIDSMIEETEIELVDFAITHDEVDEEWVVTALLCTCMRGIVYGEIPDTMDVND